MAPRSSWKGFIKLSLVSVPVKAFTANNTGEEIRLNQLHKGCHGRVRYKKVCAEHGELKADEIISGYEYAKDQYVVIDTDELTKLRPKSDKAVSIDGFVDADAIDPVFFAGKTYYLLPDGVAGGKPYALLHRGMLDANKVAIASVVVAGREQLVMLRPIEDMLAMSVLHVSKKVKGLAPYREELGTQKLAKGELALTKTLIEASTIEDFDYSSYEDEYVEKLGKLIQMKVDGQEIVQAPDPEEPKIINLMEALKESVAAAQAESGRKMAPSAKKTRKTTAKKTAAKAAKKSTTRRRKSG